MKTINVTLKIEESNVTAFEKELRSLFEVIDYKILPDTDELYDSDPTFRKLVKAHKESKRVKEKYINDKNNNHG